MYNFKEWMELVAREAVTRGHWASVTCNGVYIQIYDHLRHKDNPEQVRCAQVEFNARLGTKNDEADLRAVEAKPGILTVAVVPNGESSIDWTNTKRFAPDTPLEALLDAFPNGRNVGAIVEALKRYNG